MAIKQVWPKDHSDVCIRCATCMAICPVSRVTPLFPGRSRPAPGPSGSGNRMNPRWMSGSISASAVSSVTRSALRVSISLSSTSLPRRSILTKKGGPSGTGCSLTPISSVPWHPVFAPIVNFFLRNWAVKWLLDTVLKDRSREGNSRLINLPRSGNGSGDTVLRVDERSPISMDALQTRTRSMWERPRSRCLRQTGYEVTLPPQDAAVSPCLGSEISKGRVRWGFKNVPSLLEAVRSGTDILFSSTSCGHMIKHEYSHLFNISGSEETGPTPLRSL